MYYHLNDNDLKSLHAVQLELLDEVHRICEKHKIKYIISGGTLLGAVRGKGFIPWDDDIDIRMERNEYNKFCHICPYEIDSDKFFFQTYKTDKNYPWFYAKLRYNKSKYTRCGQEHMKMHNGIFIDIMPADGVPNSVWGQKRISEICYILKKILYSSVGKKSENNIFKRYGYRIMNIIPKSLVYLAFELMANKYKNPKYKYVTCYSFVKWNQTEYTPRSWHLKRRKYDFETKKYYSTCEFEEWLKMTYGKDYMKLPPVEERYGHNIISEFSIEGGKNKK